MPELIRKHFEERESWLAGRRETGIGASEAAAVVGLSPWLTANQLWRKLRGEWEPPQVSHRPAVERGNRMEGALREMFAALHPELLAEHFPYDILAQEKRPWLFATLDGELTRKEDGGRGILEIKTAAPAGRKGWESWEGRVPQHYYVQILHQLLATGWDFVFLFAGLWNQKGEIVLREYSFLREDCKGDMEWLEEKEEAFFRRVKEGRLPEVMLQL